MWLQGFIIHRCGHGGVKQGGQRAGYGLRHRIRLKRETDQRGGISIIRNGAVVFRKKKDNALSRRIIAHGRLYTITRKNATRPCGLSRAGGVFTFVPRQ